MSEWHLLSSLLLVLEEISKFTSEQKESSEPVSTLQSYVLMRRAVLTAPYG